jgi:hypothetical protein
MLAVVLDILPLEALLRMPLRHVRIEAEVRGERQERRGSGVQDGVRSRSTPHVENSMPAPYSLEHFAAEQVGRWCRRKHVLRDVQAQPHVLDIVSTKVTQLGNHLVVPVMQPLRSLGRNPRDVRLVHPPGHYMSARNRAGLMA